MDRVMVGIPVSLEATDLLRDLARVEAVGRLVKPETAAMDPLAALIAEVKAEARADGLTEAEIEAELSAYNAERRS